ncbi:hypothetical protein LAUMK41_00879 [Mycobacterium attenuatum]|nr:hypothetical protein LAUMK41_00879 [Mycobacterium attenuatum]
MGSHPYGGGFVLPLTYGTHTDWYRNLMPVLARSMGKGIGALDWKGHSYRPEGPELDSGVEPMRVWPASERSMLQSAKIHDLVWLHQSSEPDPGEICHRQQLLSAILAHILLRIRQLPRTRDFNNHISIWRQYGGRYLDPSAAPAAEGSALNQVQFTVCGCQAVGARAAAIRQRLLAPGYQHPLYGHRWPANATIISEH